MVIRPVLICCFLKKFVSISILTYSESSETVSRFVVSLFDPLPARLLCPWNYPGKNPGVGSHSLLQEIVPTQTSNPSLPHCRQILYCLSYSGSPFKL